MTRASAPRRAASSSQWTEARPPRSRGLEYLIALAILSLFTNLRFQTGFFYLRPFDALVGMMVMLTLVSIRRKPIFAFGAMALLPYFVWHIISSAPLGASNILREGLQIATVSLFALTIMVNLRRLDYRLLGRLMLAGLVLITLFNIGWHIANGFYTGWKRLHDPKAAFTFLPMVGALFLLFMPAAVRRLSWLLWSFYGFVILQSGERKALIVFLLLTAALLSGGRLMAVLPLLAVAIGGLSLLAAVSENPYITRQLGTILDPLGYQSGTDVMYGAAAESISNAQRSFALTVSKKMIADHPFTGVGTNAYLDIVRNQYAGLPDYMQASIHGEFLRIPAENGLIGLFLYLCVWGISLFRTRQILTQFRKSGQIRRYDPTILLLIFFIPCAFFVGFESAGTRSFMVLIFISLLPEFLRYGLPQTHFVRARTP